MANQTDRWWAVLVLEDALGITKINQYLAAYDLEDNDGNGSFGFTPNIADAMAWISPGAIMQAMNETPKCHPIRLNDGQPNRPLRTWTVQLVELPATIVQQQSARQKGH